jgi:hypothetical protein
LAVISNKVKALIQTLTWQFGIIEKPHRYFTPTDFTILVGVWNMGKGLTKICFVQ